MIKTLQKKFIITAMIAISVLIVVLLGTVNVVNIVRINNRISSMMEAISENDRIFGGNEFGDRPEDIPEDLRFEKPEDIDDNALEEADEEADDEDKYDDFPEEMTYDRPENRDDRFRLFNPVVNEDDKLSAVYFLVRLDNDGNVVFTDVNNISSVDEEAAAEYAKEVVAEDKKEGKVDNYRYIISQSPDGRGQTIVFMDVHSQTQSILAVIIVSIGIGLLCLIFMLLLVIALSKKAIKPIAENIERQKQFITDAGHEIKTPLAIILANTDAMELHNGENKWSKNIRKQTTRLGELMQRMLSLSKMDEGTAKLKFEELDITKLVKDTADSFKESADKKNIVIEKDIEENVYCKADKESMTQLINILLDNSVKYADEESVINIKLKNHDKHMKLSVSNACSNLPDVSPEKMFDRFYRGDSARTQKGGGFGIGLSVAQAVAQSHKGNITAKYKEDNVICFEVTI